MVNLAVDIKGLHLKNPVMTASGCSGFGHELNDFYDVSGVGALVLKGLTLRNREGNPYPRMVETSSGMLNAVGLQNKGIDYFISHIYPRIRNFDTSLIVNINGASVEEYVEITHRLNELERIDAVELNISCPNVKEGGMSFGISCPSAARVTREVRNACRKPLIVKLSPNVTDITEIARAVEDQGADAVSLVNTFLGMAIDAEKRIPLLSTITGGLSGPAIKPIALRMVWQVAKSIKIPVIGLGGIMNAADAIEFLLAGATAVQIGTALFLNPFAPVTIVEGIIDYMNRHHLSGIRQITGGLQV